MSTRSNIARLDPETGRVHSIYCHFDGYPAGVGATLAAHYTDGETVKQLIALGDISVLAEHVAPPPGTPHTFIKPLDGVTIAYARDRGEAWEHVKPSDHHSVMAWVTASLANMGYEHLYLFRDNAWHHVDANAVRAQLRQLLDCAPFARGAA